MSLIIRESGASDARAMTEIYNYYVLQTIVTFEEEAISVDDMARRISAVHSAGLPWLIAEENGSLRGWAYAAQWRVRRAYRFAVEVTVYVAPDHGRRGIASQLYGQLMPMLVERGFHCAMGGIALPNDASVALHEKFGFQKAAHFKEAGFKFGRWIDVGYWQRVFS